MTYPLALNPPLAPGLFAGIFAPEVSSVEIAEEDRRTMGYLASVLLDPTYQAEMALSRLYYGCLNVVQSLGIAIPPELEALRACLGWCQVGVDERSARLNVMGFRMPDQLAVDDDMQAIWQANNLDSDSPLVHDDALICGRSFVILGVDPDQEQPLITPEAPENMLGSWDPRTRDLSAAFQTYIDQDVASPTYIRQLATLYTRMSTIQLMRGDDGWIVQDRNDHGMGFVPVEMFTVAPTIRRRYGTSVMGPAWRNTQDRACRTLVRGEVASEFWATMKIFILGATEESFKNSDGSIATAWQTFIGRLSALKADEFGNVPTIKEVRGESPDGIITTFDQQAKIMAGHMGLAPSYLGVYSDGNPSSADAIRMEDFRLKTAADRLSIGFGNSWENSMRKCQRIKGAPTDGMDQLETDWAFTGIPTPNADAVTVTAQMAAGAIPPTSDDALAHMGWTAVERKRIALERKKTAGMAVLDQALAGFKNQQPAADGKTPGQQPMDGQQPQALAGLNSQRTGGNGQSG